MRIFVIFLLISIHTNAQKKSKNVVFRQIQQSLNKKFNHEFYPIIFPSADTATWKDSAFFLNVEFHINKDGYMDKFHLLNNTHKWYQNISSEIFRTFVSNRKQHKYNTFKNKILSFSIFCLPCAWDGETYFWGDHCNIQFDGDELYLINQRQTSDSIVIMPIMPIRIIETNIIN